jgi:NagD protein
VDDLRSKNGFICDMDGVIYHGNQLLPGAKRYVEWLQSGGGGSSSSPMLASALRGN